MSDELDVPAPAPPSLLADCWRWPLASGGWALLPGVALGVLGYQMVAAMPLVGDLAPLLVGAPLAACVSALVLESVTVSASGRPGPPDWPDLADLGELGHALLLTFAATAMACFPATALKMATDLAQGWQRTLHVALLVLGASYAPACLLGVSLTRSLDGVDPRRAMPAVVRLGPGYLAAWALAAALIVVASYWPTYGTRWLPWGGASLQWALMAYVALVLCRLVGRLYAANADRIDF